MKTRIGSIFICTTLVASIFAGITFNLGNLSMNASGEGGLADSPWPMFRQNLNHTGLSPYDTSGNNGQLLWSFTTGGIVYSSPAIGTDGTIYFGSVDNKLYAINPGGTEKWNFTAGDRIEWSSPAIDPAGTIYIGSYDYKLYAINSDGTEKWNFTTAPGAGIASSPTIDYTGTIYVGSNNYLYAINPDGTEKWSFKTTGGIVSSPAIGSDVTIYVGSSEPGNKLYAINPDGTEKWNFTTNGAVFSSPSIGSDDTIYVGSNDHNLYAINPDGSEKWNFTTGGQIDSSPAIGTDGTIYVGSRDNRLYAINPDGTEKWNFTTGDFIYHSSPAISSEGTIYIGSQDCKLYAINPDGSEKWNFTAGNAVLSSPVISAYGTIYVGSYDHKLYAIGLPNVSVMVQASPDLTINEGEAVNFNGTAFKKVMYPAWPVDISGNNQYLALGWDKNVTLFRTSSNVPVWTYNTGGLGWVGSRINVLYFNTSSDVPLWDVSIGDPTTVIYDGDPGNRLDMTRDGKYVAAAAGGNRVLVYDTTSATPTVPYWDIYHGSEVNVVRFSGDGRYLTIAAKNGHIKLCWIPDKNINWTYSAGDMVYSTSISYTGNDISSGLGNNHKVHFFGSWSSTPTWSHTLGGRQFEQIMSDDGIYLVSGNHHDGTVGSWSGFAFWDTSSSTPIWEYHIGSVYDLNGDAVDMDCQANYVVGGSRDDHVYLFSQLADNVSGWGPSDGVPIFSFDTGGNINYNGVSLSYDGTYFAVGSFGSGLYLFTTVGTPTLLWSWFANNLVYVQDPNMYRWDFNDFEDSDGDGNYLNDIDATGKTPTHIYGDDGEYSVNLRITENNETLGDDTCIIKVNNVAPTIDPFGPLVVEVGACLEIDITASDPGSDDLTFSWEWGDGTTETILHYYNDGMSPDPFPSPSGIFPFSVPITVQHVYKYEGIYTVNLTVEDDDGGIAEYNTTVMVISISPPTLYINTSADRKNATLYWDSPSSLGLDHYLIYRSTSQTGFDFENIWVNTSEDKELHEAVPIPLRTMWNDTNAAFPDNETNYEEQYYYIIRAVNKLGEISTTSRTVGKWTRAFPEGASAFSLPLEPLETMNTTIDHYLKDMSAAHIRWMDPINHYWMKHGEGVVNDTQLEVGKGYEVKFGSETNYTFTGMPGAMIIYDDDAGFIGFDPDTDARNLTATADPLTGNITLNWTKPSCKGVNNQYHVLRSTARDGFWTGNYVQLATLSFNILSFTDVGNATAGTQYYYMIVPVNETGVEGASTYSIGVWTANFSEQYDTIGMPLKVVNNETVDWYCDNIPDAVGINYYNVGAQRWSWHSTRIPEGAFDPILVMTEGYQISTTNTTKFTFIGV